MVGKLKASDAIIRFNYDCLIERALEEAGKSHNVIVTDEDVSSWKEDTVNLLKIHGCVNQRASIVITTDDYWEFFERRPNIANILGSEAAKHSLLFVGHGLEDTDFNRIYLQVTRNLAKFRRKSYAVQLNPNPVDVDFWKPKRLEIIRRMLDILRQDAPWVFDFHGLNYALYHKWCRNVHPHALAYNTEKYVRLYTKSRRAYRGRHNQPVWWPLAALGLLVVVPAVPGVRAAARHFREV